MLLPFLAVLFPAWVAPPGRVMRLKKDAIQAIKNSGIPYCIFYPSSFMENLNNGYIQGNRVNIAGKPVYKNW
jgi:uncharacterized protein YbjT (DUF2867 family)